MDQKSKTNQKITLETGLDTRTGLENWFVYSVWNGTRKTISLSRKNYSAFQCSSTGPRTWPGARLTASVRRGSKKELRKQRYPKHLYERVQLPCCLTGSMVDQCFWSSPVWFLPRGEGSGALRRSQNAADTSPFKNTFKNMF